MISGVVSLSTFSTGDLKQVLITTIEDGVIYIRGQFVKVSRQTLLLTNSNTETTRVGLTVTESLITEEDSTLTDNTIRGFI